jgi:putative ABC transport system permease protein
MLWTTLVLAFRSIRRHTLRSFLTTLGIVIGVAAVMLVSVTERTREIGIRLAIGALAHEVRMQFLVEAVALSCLGGLIGLILAQLAVLGIAPLMKLGWSFDPTINLVAFAISAVIGIVFGFFPARRAAALDPIDALRHE